MEVSDSQESNGPKELGERTFDEINGLLNEQSMVGTQENSPTKANEQPSESKKKIKKLPNIQINVGENAIQEKQYKFKSNIVKTTKYNLVTWAPKSLILQFKRAANIYFFFITIFTSLSFSPKNPASQIWTFCIVLFFTMLKEGFEDFKRFQQDKEVNFMKAEVWDYAKRSFEIKLWQNIKVGDLVRVSKDKQFPADIVLCKSSNENGLAYVDTMNLDGETNLKEKACFKEAKDLDVGDFTASKGVFTVEAPSEYLERWEGSYMSSTFNNRPVIVNMKQLLVRGTELKNTEWITGFVVYCGHTTKVMLNAKRPPSKTSNVLKIMNKMLYSVFVFQFFLIVLFSLFGYLWQRAYAESHFYIGEDPIDLWYKPGHWLKRFIIFLVAYSHLIPISLYVALEVLKLCQGVLIKRDQDMYYAPLDCSANVKTSDLVEEIGQIEFLFSDKTGTLTCNMMELKKVCINGKSYGGLPEDQKEEYSKGIKPKYSVDWDIAPYEALLDKNSPEGPYVHEFFKHLALCHTVVIDSKQLPDSPEGKLAYQASSPDELALVEGAASMGYTFCKRTSHSISYNILNRLEEEWDVCAEIPFDSSRKRMSVVVRKKGTSEYLLLTKGADNVMLPLLVGDKQKTRRTQEYLDNYALEGLRTLLMAKRSLSKSEFHEFESSLENIKSSSGPEKNFLLNELYEKMEKNLELVGASAIEDKLQDNVPETIAKLMSAWIRIWVLTGDKQETAIEIGKSCQLVLPEMELIILSSKTREEFIEKLEEQMTSYAIDMKKPIRSLSSMKPDPDQKLICIVIDGPTLTWALERTKENIPSKFFRLGLLASSCICCRVSPKQKADVVALVKRHGPWITLAIGDGANDVSMIMEAHVGVGVHGKEGSQAVRSADFSIGQFSFLQKLLLVHGRWAYRRISVFICYYFYKNVIVVFCEIYFALFNGFSGQIYFLDWLPMLYNSLWTSWPCLFNFALDQDCNIEYSFRYPKLYTAGPKNYYFNMKVFWVWIIYAFFHGTVCFWLPVFGLPGVSNSSGIINDHWYLTTISFSLIMNIITIKLFSETFFWTRYNLLVGLASIIFYYFCIIILNIPGIARILQPQLEMLVFYIFSHARAWFVVLLVPFLALGPDIITYVIRALFFPNPIMKVMRRQLQSKDLAFRKDKKPSSLLKKAKMPKKE